jgi:hypothetical protein
MCRVKRRERGPIHGFLAFRGDATAAEWRCLRKVEQAVLFTKMRHCPDTLMQQRAWEG